MSRITPEELEAIRMRIYNGESELISTLSPEAFFAMMANDYDVGFAAGKDSAKKEFLCMLAASGMGPTEISLILNIKLDVVREIMETKRAHIEKCRKKLEQRRSK